MSAIFRDGGCDGHFQYLDNEPFRIIELQEREVVKLIREIANEQVLASKTIVGIDTINTAQMIIDFT